MTGRSAFGAEPEHLRELLSFGLVDSVGQKVAPTAAFGSILERPGGRIGRYKLLSILGQGGMGVVYLAEQVEPIRRHVALKVVRPGMDSERVISRFEAERQALALLDHPNIAHVHDAGTTDTGRPFFVMEYVKGLSITEHCDRHMLTIENRLELFLQVCRAVHHAHQKGIIHRDIKPSNILVSTQDDDAVPKIIDFGIAKAMSQPLTERTFYTEQGQLIGTPEYMSPEQADINNQDVDTRTDVYSLGIVLYKLLSGLLPFDAKTFRTGGIDKIRKVICEEDPKTPSSRLITASKEDSSESANLRKTDIRTLHHKLCGDLDWITLKALEKDRKRRYAGVDALAADIYNYLHHQPVTAAPPRALYRARKFARRHREEIAAGGIAVLLILVCLWAGWAYIRAEKEHMYAEQLEHERVLADAKKFIETRGTPGVPNTSQNVLELIKPLLDSRYVGPQAQLLSAGILVEDRLYDQAVPELEALSHLEDNPELAGAAHALLARVIWESQSLGEKELAKIEEHKEKAEQLLPSTAEAYYLRAMTALTIPEKLNVLTEALQLDAAHYPSRRLRALTYYASRKYEHLRDDALLMSYTRPNDPMGYSLRAAALKGLGDYRESLKCYDTAIKLTTERDSQYIELNGRRCEVLMKIGEYERVLTDARNCLTVVPEARIMYFHTFCALIALGRYEEASSLFRNLVESDPEAGTRIRDWSMKYVFDMLEAGSAWHPPDSVPEGPVFLYMLIADRTHRELSNKTHRLITDCFSGRWSPNGTQIAFSMGVQGFSGVAVYDLRSQQTDLLIVPGKDPSWSPDGRQIAFVRDCEALPLSEFTTAERRFQPRASEDEEVWVMNADGTEPRRLARGGGWPSWSTDSRCVYYQSRIDNMLCRISTEESQPKPVPVFACSSSLPSVSPDEQYAGYVEDGALKITDLTTSSCISQWALCMPMWGGNWAPDGREFAFGGTSQYVEARAGLWIYDVQDKEAKQVLTGQIISAAWSFDKTRMLLSLGPPYFEIWVADLDPNLPTAEALGPARSVEDILEEWVEISNRELEVDPNLLLTHWVRTASAMWLDDDDRASVYLQEMSDAIDRQPGQIGLCHWASMGTFARPEVNKRVLPLTLMLARKVVERRPAYARDFAFALYETGHREEAARFWHIGEAASLHGSCKYDRQSNSYDIVGYGKDIWGKLDDFRFAYTTLRGDGSITAKLESVENANEWTKAGIMIRNSLEPGSPNAMLLVTPRGIVSFQNRVRVSEATIQKFLRSDNIQPPHWLRLKRKGNSLTAQHSADGVNWDDVIDSTGQLIRAQIPMNDTVYLGLAVTSHNLADTALARFSHVSTAGQVNPPGSFTESRDITLTFPADAQ